MTFYDDLKKSKLTLLISIVSASLFIIINFLMFGCCMSQLTLFTTFFILFIGLSYHFSIKTLKNSEKKHIFEQNLAVGKLSKKYKESIEQMYDEHIFSITHELRSPLAVINSCSTESLNEIRNIYNELYELKCMKKLDKNKFKKIKNRINTIDKQVDIIESFIANLGTYGSYISARSNDQFKITEIFPYLKSMIQNAPTFSRNMKILNNNIRIINNKDFKTVHTTINSNDLTRILMNVFKNSADAIFYSYQDLKNNRENFRPEIKIRCLKTPDQKNMILKDDIIGPFGKYRKESPLYIVIEDNGPGISKENQNKIFKYGFSTKSEKQNLGMGLHVSMQIAENNDLSLFIKTNENGTKFIIGFPNILYFENDNKNPTDGWQADPKNVCISDDSKKLYDELVKSTLS